MKRFNSKIILVVIVIFFSSCFVALILNQQNFFKNEGRNEESKIKTTNLKLSDNPQESENISSYQKYEEFWSNVYLLGKDNWSYSDWREYIILQVYGVSEDNLNETIKNDLLFENNIDIFTLYVWGMYNGSLTEEDIYNFAKIAF